MNELPVRKKVVGTAIALRENDIDTDRIIPARYMRSVTFEGLGEYAFYDARFDGNGRQKDHPFNRKEFQGASILVVNRNFGCGSSREHAPQALARWGINAIVGGSFAEIFAGNCVSMGVPAVTLGANDIEELLSLIEKAPDTAVEIDLEGKTVLAGGKRYPLDIAETRRQSLLLGLWDAAAELFQNVDKIRKTAENLPYLKF
jgi:3-isopropylmalate/(R)-2-methylmalate dehydratase small subunit